MISLKFTVLIILILAFYYQPIAGKCPSCPEECCFSFRKKPFPLKAISTYRTTPDYCHLYAVVIVTKGGKNICTRYEERWVQRVMQVIRKK